MKSRTLAAALTGLLLVITACGGSDDAVESTTTEAEAVGDDLEAEVDAASPEETDADAKEAPEEEKVAESSEAMEMAPGFVLSPGGGVVSFSPTYTQVMVKLGVADSLAGVDQQSDEELEEPPFPELVGFDANETAGLKPELVIIDCSDPDRTFEQLQMFSSKLRSFDLGIEVFLSDAISDAEIDADISKLGAALSVEEEAAALLSDFASGSDQRPPPPLPGANCPPDPVAPTPTTPAPTTAPTTPAPTTTAPTFTTTTAPTFTTTTAPTFTTTTAPTFTTTVTTMLDVMPPDASLDGDPL